MNPIISIIIPTYNSGEFLENALLSIQCQSFKDFEVLIVDAGSMDETKIISNSFDNRFQFHELIESKQGEARNLGLKKSIGKLIMFLDSDDVLSDEDVLMDCINNIGNNDADFYNFGVSFFMSDINIRDIKSNLRNYISGTDNILRLGLFGKEIHTIPWNKIYDRNFLIRNHILFPKLKEQEDMVFIIHCCMKASRIKFSDRRIVNADVRNDSLSRKMNSVNVSCCLDVFNSIEELLKKEQLFELFIDDFNCYKMRTSSYILLMALYRIESNKDFKKSMKIIKNSGSLKPSLSFFMMRNLRVSSIMGIIAVKFSIILRLLRVFKRFKLIKGY